MHHCFYNYYFYCYIYQYNFVYAFPHRHGGCTLVHCLFLSGRTSPVGTLLTTCYFLRQIFTVVKLLIFFLIFKIFSFLLFFTLKIILIQLFVITSINKVLEKIDISFKSTVTRQLVENFLKFLKLLICYHGNCNNSTFCI